MTSEVNLDNELKFNSKEIIEQLRKGNDIMLKATPKGLKIQSLEVKTINKNKGGN